MYIITTSRLGLVSDKERLGLGLVSDKERLVSVSAVDVSGLVSVSTAKVSCTTLPARAYHSLRVMRHDVKVQ